MAGSDSTPDFSWLNKQDDDSKSTSEEASAPAQAEPSDISNASDQLDDDHSGEDAENIESPDDVNATGETWIDPTSTYTHESAIAEQPVENASIYDDDDDDEVRTPGPESVFDESGDEREIDDNQPTIVMPGRQAISGIDDTRTNEPDDETVVLPAEKVDPVEEEIFDESSGPSSMLENVEDEPQEHTGQAEDSATAANAQDLEAVPPGRGETTAAATIVEAEPQPRSNLGFVLLASYASAMTIIALMLFMRGGDTKPHHLESLPDVQPESADSLSYVPVKATLPPGHTLALGEKQRFGNIEVQPVRVVKEPLEFTHYNADANVQRPPTEHVYKLWVRFTNVSDDQEIAPLDSDLLFRWVVKAELQQEFSNYYLFAAGTEDDRQVIPAYRHSKTSDWDLKGQQLGHVLAPGESFETYISSTDQLGNDLAEEMKWRLQFRKGFSPSGNGVTTLVDVTFRESEVKSAG